MKKVFLFISCLIVTGIFNASAQRSVYFIPKVGINITNITNTHGDWTPGMNLGFGIEWLIKQKIGIEAGLYYSEYGAKNIAIPPLNDKQTVELSYLQIPIVAKYYLLNGLHIFGGAQAGYRLSDLVKPISTNIAYNKDFVFDGLAGIGYQFNFGLMFSAGYILGINSIGQPIYAANNNSYNRRNQAFLFNMGWRF
jgi:hypothetical protein